MNAKYEISRSSKAIAVFGAIVINVIVLTSVSNLFSTTTLEVVQMSHATQIATTLVA